MWPDCPGVAVLGVVTRLSEILMVFAPDAIAQQFPFRRIQHLLQLYA